MQHNNIQGANNAPVFDNDILKQFQIAFAQDKNIYVPDIEQLTGKNPHLPLKALYQLGVTQVITLSRIRDYVIICLINLNDSIPRVQVFSSGCYFANDYVKSLLNDGGYKEFTTQIEDSLSIAQHSIVKQIYTKVTQQKSDFSKIDFLRLEHEWQQHASFHLRRTINAYLLAQLTNEEQAHLISNELIELDKQGYQTNHNNELQMFYAVAIELLATQIADEYAATSNHIHQAWLAVKPAKQLTIINYFEQEISLNFRNEDPQTYSNALFKVLINKSSTNEQVCQQLMLQDSALPAEYESQLVNIKQYLLKHLIAFVANLPQQLTYQTLRQQQAFLAEQKFISQQVPLLKQHQALTGLELTETEWRALAKGRILNLLEKNDKHQNLLFSQWSSAAKSNYIERLSRCANISYAELLMMVPNKYLSNFIHGLIKIFNLKNNFTELAKLLAVVPQHLYLMFLQAYLINMPEYLALPLIKPLPENERMPLLSSIASEGSPDEMFEKFSAIVPVYIQIIESFRRPELIKYLFDRFNDSQALGYVLQYYHSKNSNNRGMYFDLQQFLQCCSLLNRANCLHLLQTPYLFETHHFALMLPALTKYLDDAEVEEFLVNNHNAAFLQEYFIKVNAKKYPGAEIATQEIAELLRVLAFFQSHNISINNFVYGADSLLDLWGRLNSEQLKALCRSDIIGYFERFELTVLLESIHYIDRLWLILNNPKLITSKQDLVTAIVCLRDNSEDYAADITYLINRTAHLFNNLTEIKPFLTELLTRYRFEDSILTVIARQLINLNYAADNNDLDGLKNQLAEFLVLDIKRNGDYAVSRFLEVLLKLNEIEQSFLINSEAMQLFEGFTLGEVLNASCSNCMGDYLKVDLILNNSHLVKSIYDLSIVLQYLYSKCRLQDINYLLKYHSLLLNDLEAVTSLLIFMQGKDFLQLTVVKFLLDQKVGLNYDTDHLYEFIRIIRLRNHPTVVNVFHNLITNFTQLKDFLKNSEQQLLRSGINLEVYEFKLQCLKLYFAKNYNLSDYQAAIMLMGKELACDLTCAIMPPLASDAELTEILHMMRDPENNKVIDQQQRRFINSALEQGNLHYLTWLVAATPAAQRYTLVQSYEKHLLLQPQAIKDIKQLLTVEEQSCLDMLILARVSSLPLALFSQTSADKQPANAFSNYNLHKL